MFPTGIWRVLGARCGLNWYLSASIYRSSSARVHAQLCAIRATLKGGEIRRARHQNQGEFGRNMPVPRNKHVRVGVGSTCALAASSAQLPSLRLETMALSDTTVADALLVSRRCSRCWSGAGRHWQMSGCCPCLLSAGAGQGGTDCKCTCSRAGTALVFSCPASSCLQ